MADLKQTRKVVFGKRPDIKRDGWMVCHPVADSKRPFQPWKEFQVGRESRPLFEWLMPCEYAVITVPANADGVDQAVWLLNHGVNQGTIPDWDLPAYRVADHSIRDDIKLLAVPAEYKDFKLSSLGIEVGANVPQLKKAKRLWSAGSPMVWTGERQLASFADPVRVSNLGTNMSALWARLRHNSEVIQMLFLPETSQTSGMGIASPRGFRVTWDLELAYGQGRRLRGGTPLGFPKGHIYCVPGLVPDFVFFGVKPDMVLNDKVFLAIQAELHPGNEVIMDPESLINFFCTEEATSALGGLAEEQVRKLLKIAADPQQRHNYALIPPRDEESGRPQGRPWILEEFVKRGLDLGNTFPGLFVRQMSAKRTLDKMPYGRIPILGEARAAYSVPDLSGFDLRDGFFDRRRCMLQGNVVYAPYVPAGKVVTSRNPNGPGGYWKTDNVEIPRSSPMFGLGDGETFTVSPDAIEPRDGTPGMNECCEGADFDDRFIVYHGDQLRPVFDRQIRFAGR